MNSNTHPLKVSNKEFYGPVLSIHKKAYIDDLAQVTVKNGLFKNVDDSLAEAKALAKMVICSGAGMESLSKENKYISILSIFYDLVEAFYYSILWERDDSIKNKPSKMVEGLVKIEMS